MAMSTPAPPHATATDFSRHRAPTTFPFHLSQIPAMTTFNRSACKLRQNRALEVQRGVTVSTNWAEGSQKGSVPLQPEFALEETAVMEEIHKKPARMDCTSISALLFAESG
jgi:hypothetical protein